MVCSPAKLSSTSPCTSRCVTSLRNTEFGSAIDCKRAAKFTVSPRTASPPPARSSTLPTTAGPVLMPIRICGRKPCFASRFGPSASRLCRMESAAREARSGASSNAIGAPKTAMMPSPVKSCTTPPCSCTASDMILHKLRMRVKAASSPARSEKLVKPTMSANRTVTCLRSASKRSSGR